MPDEDDEAREEGGFGGGGFGDILAQFQDAEHRLEEAAAEASATIVTGSAAGGQVSVEISGDLEALSLHIDPALVDPADVSMLEDLVLAALRDALAQVSQLQADVADSFEAPSIDLSGLLGNLGNLANLGGVGGVGGLGEPGGSGPGDLGDLSGLLGGMGLGSGESTPGAGEPVVQDAGDDDDDDAPGESR